MSGLRLVVTKLSTVASRAPHWLFTVFIVGAAAGLSLLSLSFLLLNFATDYRSLTVKRPFVIVDAPIAPPYEAVPSAEVEPTIPHATVTFQIQKHLLQDNKVSVSIQLSVPDE